MSETAMNNAATLLAAFLLIALLVVGVWDIYATTSSGRWASVSDVITDWSRVYPVLPLLVGLVMGHIFWR